MKYYTIHYINGWTQEYETLETEAKSKEEAIHKVWEQYPGNDFDHQIIEVKETDIIVGVGRFGDREDNEVLLYRIPNYLSHERIYRDGNRVGSEYVE